MEITNSTKMILISILIEKVLAMHKTYGISVDQICSDMKGKLLDEYGGEANYPHIISGLEQYRPISLEEAEVKSALLKYLSAD